MFLHLVLTYSDSNSDNNQQTINQTQNIATNGTWRITYFYDTDHEETSNFTGFNFSFNSDGSLVATDGNSTITGTWSVTDSSSSSSSSSNDLHFNIFFAAPPNFENLSDDWNIISVSALIK